MAAQSREINAQRAHDPRDVLEFMATLRIHHQALQMARGQAADRHLSLGQISNFEPRGQLKDAFGVVQTCRACWHSAVAERAPSPCSGSWSGRTPGLSAGPRA